MKILWITKKYFDQDVDTATWVEVTKEMIKRGHNIKLFGLYKKEKKDFKLGKDFIQIRSRFNDIRAVSRIYKTLYITFFIYYNVFFCKWDAFILNYQLVLTITPLRILSMLKLVNTKFILDIRTFPNETGSWREKFLEWEFNTIIKFAKKLLDGLTVITPAMKGKLIKRYGLSSDEIGIWTSGVNIDIFSRKNVRKLPDYELRFKGKFVVFFHGALSEMRGMDKAIRAVKLLVPKYGDKIILFILSFGRLKEAYEGLIKELDLWDNVFIENVVQYESVPSYINLIDIGIMPYYDVNYWNTSNPIKLLEYLAMEKPVIVSDIRSHRDVIGKSSCGIYIGDNDPKTIAQAVERAYKLGDRLKEYGKKGRDIVAEKYTWSKCANDLLTYIKSVTEE